MGRGLVHDAVARFVLAAEFPAHPRGLAQGLEGQRRLCARARVVGVAALMGAPGDAGLDAVGSSTSVRPGAFRIIGKRQKAAQAVGAGVGVAPIPDNHNRSGRNDSNEFETVQNPYPALSDALTYFSAAARLLATSRFAACVAKAVRI